MARRGARSETIINRRYNFSFDFLYLHLSCRPRRILILDLRWPAVGPYNVHCLFSFFFFFFRSFTLYAQYRRILYIFRIIHGRPRQPVTTTGRRQTRCARVRYARPPACRRPCSIALDGPLSPSPPPPHHTPPRQTASVRIVCRPPPPRHCRRGSHCWSGRPRAVQPRVVVALAAAAAVCRDVWS